MNDDNKSIRLMLAYLCIANEAEASLVRKVEILDRFEIKDEEIAQVCGVKVQSVQNSRQILKKSRYAITKKEKHS